MAGDTDSWSVMDALRWTTGFFRGRKIEQPRLDAEVLLGHVLGLSRVQLYTQFERPLDPDEKAGYREAIKRRVQREPVAYIVGEKEFWSLPFKVDKRVLVPRPDTELVVELARQRARELVGMLSLAEREALAEQKRHEQAERLEELTEANELDEVQQDATMAAEARDPLAETLEHVDIVDVGTGSGIIAIALAHELPFARICASDIHEDIVALARQNAEALSQNDITWGVGSLLAPWSDQRFHLVVSNPPYIAEGQLGSLAPEVAEHEPKHALLAGQDGLDIIRRLARQAFEVLHPGGYFICEIGSDQGTTAPRALADGAQWRNIRVVKDPHTGHQRVIEARR